MIERSARIWTENLARSLNRRKFLKKTGEAAFVGMAALMSGNLTAMAAQGRDPAPKLSPNISCAPPGPYCSVNGVATDGCKGANCYQHLYQGTVVQCQVFYIYQAGCWTTPSGNGYWTCCDCHCYNTSGQQVASCGCAQFSTAPVPRPDGPSAG